MYGLDGDTLNVFQPWSRIGRVLTSYGELVESSEMVD